MGGLPDRPFETPSNLVDHCTVLLDQLTYLDSALAEAESFAAEIGAHKSDHSQKMAQVAAIESEIVKVLSEVENRAAPAKVQDPIWAEASYIQRCVSPKKHLRQRQLADWAPENRKVDQQLSRMCEASAYCLAQPY